MHNNNNEFKRNRCCLPGWRGGGGRGGIHVNSCSAAVHPHGHLPYPPNDSITKYSNGKGQDGYNA